MTNLSAHEEPIAKIFSSDYQFSIPEYQRPYAWTTEQAIQLLEDLRDALKRSEEADPYFLGSVVLIKAIGDSASEVIDGQQRLTTITILLSLLRHLSQNEKLVQSYDNMISEPGNELMQRAAQPRLTLRTRDSDFFRSYIQEGKVTELLAMQDGNLANDAQKNIRDNSKALFTELQSWTEEERTALGRLIGARTFLVVVATSDIASAHRVFNVMNSRGLDLSAADIFKSRVIGELPSELAEAYASKWEDAEDSLGRQSFQDLFLHIRVIFAKSRAQRELLHEFPEQVLNQFLPKQAAKFVDEVLLPYAEAYSTIENESYSWPEGAEQVNAWLRRLNLVDNNDWKPVALWILHTYRSEPATLADLLERLERIASVMLIQRVYATPRAMRYASLIKSLDAGMGPESQEFLVSDQDKRAALLQLNGPIYNMAPVRKYVLLRLNELLSSAPVRFNPKIITVEHVLPQNPSKGSEWVDDFTESEIEYWTHRLGNLVLLDKKKNSEAQNFDFEKKKNRYFRSSSGVTPFTLTMEVLDAGSWKPDDLLVRQRRLIEKLAKNWDISRDSNGVNLATLSESELTALPESTPSENKGGRRVLLSDLIKQGLLEPDTPIVWDRPRVGESHRATVTETGQIRLEDGRLFDTPSRAAKDAAGVEAQDGWEAWALPDGRRIGELWKAYQALTVDGDSDSSVERP